jgi:hypothetical protein
MDRGSPGATRRDGNAGASQRLAHELLVVDGESEMPPVIGRGGATLGERDELIAHVDEGHARFAIDAADREDRTVERHGLLQVADLEGDVVDADHACEPLRHAHSMANVGRDESG